jgi:hypothetical protein
MEHGSAALALLNLHRLLRLRNQERPKSFSKPMTSRPGAGGERKAGNLPCDHISKISTPQIDPRIAFSATK